MCTVIVQVPDSPEGPTRLLAVRDEDPNRPWDPPGAWWPSEHPGVVGVRDRRANGAWLAENPSTGRLSVLLNRNPEVLASPDDQLESRGGIVLASIQGASIPDAPNTATFNLIEISGAHTGLVSWTGARLHRETPRPGVHMIAHDDLDDPGTARVARWLPDFRELAAQWDSHVPFEDWRQQWLDLLASSGQLGPDDDEAIIRDNRPHGYPTLSLLVCVAEIHVDTVALAWSMLPEPGSLEGATPLAQIV